MHATLKIVSVSPKRNHVSPLSELSSHTSLDRIYRLVWRKSTERFILTMMNLCVSNVVIGKQGQGHQNLMMYLTIPNI